MQRIVRKPYKELVRVGQEGSELQRVARLIEIQLMGNLQSMEIHQKCIAAETHQSDRGACILQAIAPTQFLKRCASTSPSTPRIELSTSMVKMWPVLLPTM